MREQVVTTGKKVEWLWGVLYIHKQKYYISEYYINVIWWWCVCACYIISIQVPRKLIEPPYVTLKRIEDRAVDTLLPSALGDFVIVTAIDYSHFGESFDAIASSFLHFPNNTILVYDLGLRPDQVTEVGEAINLFWYCLFNGVTQKHILAHDQVATCSLGCFAYCLLSFHVVNYYLLLNCISSNQHRVCWAQNVSRVSLSQTLNCFLWPVYWVMDWCISLLIYFICLYLTEQIHAKPNETNKLNSRAEKVSPGTYGIHPNPIPPMVAQNLDAIAQISGCHELSVRRI